MLRFRVFIPTIANDDFQTILKKKKKQVQDAFLDGFAMKIVSVSILREEDKNRALENQLFAPHGF